MEAVKAIRLEGIVRASRFNEKSVGKQFLGAIIECDGGRRWVIDYDEQTPFRAFAGHRVVASGEPYEPESEGQHLIGRGPDNHLRHLRVSTMRLVEGLIGAELVEVGEGQRLRGHFERGLIGTEDAMLSFVVEEGDTFLVANDPAGVAAGRTVDVQAYPVELAPSIDRPLGRYLWTISPCSVAELCKWRERHP